MKAATSRLAIELAALTAFVVTSATHVSAEILFAYDSSLGSLPTAQGWGGFEIDSTGPLGAVNTASPAANFANAVLEDVGGVQTLHIRDTLSDTGFDLPSFYYPWTVQQQQSLLNNGLKFTMVFQGLATTGSGKGNVRFGFNGTEFEIQNTNISPDQTVEVGNFSSSLAPINGQFHTLEILGQKVGTEFVFTYRVDGGTESPRNIISNPAPATIESTVYFGGSQSSGIGTDMLVRSITMETLNLVEPVLATIDRNNGPRGTLTLVNNSAPMNIVGYSITSAEGALDSMAWTSITDVYDSNGNDSVDPNDTWVELSNPTARDNLSEFEPDGDGAILAVGQSIALGNVWIQNPNEDVAMELLLADGTQLPINVLFEGNGDERFEFGDLDFDGDFDVLDFRNEFVAGFGANTASLSAAERYQAGDFNEDGTVDEFDFLIYNAAYLDANPGAATLSLAAVPEPAAVALAGLAALALSVYPRARRRALLALLGVGVAASLSTSESHAADLLAHWKFNESAGASVAADSTGGGHAATNVGTTTSGAAGLLGNAWQFTGGANHLLVATAPSNDSLLTLETDFSYSGWVKTSTTSALGTMFSISDNTQQNEEILLRATSDQGASGFGSADFGARPGIMPGEAVSVSKINNNQWRFLTIAQDSTGWSLYVDGALEDSGVAADGLANPLAVGANNATIGAFHRLSGVTWGLNGLIDDLAVWNGRLTDNEVRNLYLGGLNGADAATPFNATLSLSVNEDTGAVALGNTSGIDFDIDLYRIRSVANSLTPGLWSSFDDVNRDAGVWTELSGTVGKVSEGALGESTLLADGMPAISLGNLYNTTIDAKDLILEYHISGMPATSLYTGSVAYVTGGATDADFDNDVDVDGSDFLTWQRNLGNNSGTATNSQGDANQDGNVTGADLAAWRQNFGPAGAASAAQAVPEPSTLAMTLLAGVAAVLLSVRQTRRTVPAVVRVAFSAAAIAVTAASISNAATVDRDYRLGDDSAENADPGITLGSANSFGSTFDSAGGSGDGDLQDLNIGGNPTYISVADRPGAGGALGASFDGVDDFLWTPINFGVPQNVWDNTTFFPVTGTPFPHNYEGIRGQGMQLWVKPNSSLQNVRQEIIKNTGEHGVVITEDNRWGLISDAEPVVNSGAPVAFNQWTHVMMLGGVSDRTNGRSNVGGVLLVNGVAVAAKNEPYEFVEDQLLTVGGFQNTQADALTNPFRGAIDDVEVFLWGTSSTTAANYGTLNLGVDNEWIATQLAGKNLVDVNLDGVVSGTGTGPAATDDVSKLIQGWRSRRVVNGVQVGDWTSRQQGDLNFDGIVDLGDAFLLRQELAAATGFALDLSMLANLAVPEPSSAALAALGLAALVRRRRRQPSL
jgi:hypothetical protein